MIELLAPTHWKDYELIDCGDFEKLERFGNLVLIRPEPQAVWCKQLSPGEWQRLHHIKFKGRSATTGEWIKKNANIPDRWHIEYKNPEASIKFRLALTSFKHVGIFPEQAVNWDYITACLKKFKTPEPTCLPIRAARRSSRGQQGPIPPTSIPSSKWLPGPTKIRNFLV